MIDETLPQPGKSIVLSVLRDADRCAIDLSLSGRSAILWLETRDPRPHLRLS
jgi:hypothetical protein